MDENEKITTHEDLHSLLMSQSAEVVNKILYKDFFEQMDKRICREQISEPVRILSELKKIFVSHFNLSLDIYKYDGIRWEGWDVQLRTIKREKLTSDKVFCSDGKYCTEAFSQDGFFYHDEEILSTKASIRVRFKLWDDRFENYILIFSGVRKELERVEFLFDNTQLYQLLRAKLSLFKEYIDDLTWLYNKKYLELFKDKNYSLIIIDINDFKKINDTFWHLKWDEILIDLWTIIRESIRLEDRAFRVGWDEFAILIDSGDEVLMLAIEKRILGTVNRKGDLKYKISIGHELYQEWVPFEEMYIKADFSMYDIKNKKGQEYRVKEKIKNHLKNANIWYILRVIISLNKVLFFILLSKIFGRHK